MEFLDLAIHKHDFPMLPICYMLVCQRVSIKLSPEPPGSKSWEQERGGGGPESVRWRLRADTEGGEKPCGRPGFPAWSIKLGETRGWVEPEMVAQFKQLKLVKHSWFNDLKLGKQRIAKSGLFQNKGYAHNLWLWLGCPITHLRL